MVNIYQKKEKVMLKLRTKRYNGAHYWRSFVLISAV